MEIDNKYIDLNNSTASMMIRIGRYKGLLEKLVADPNFGELVDAINSNNVALIGDKSHAIKGMAGNLGLTALYESAVSVMNAAREGKSVLELNQKYLEEKEKTFIIIDHYLKEH